MAAGSASAAGEWSHVSADYGRANGDIDAFRVGIQRPFDGNLYESGSMALSGYFEASLNYWKGSSNEIFAAAISPVFTASFCSDCRHVPYVEAGIGVALLSDNQIDGRNLSTAFQFEDRIGVGLRSDKLDLHVRYMHYSNADISKPNDGVDMYVAGLAYKF
jgi:lipid A 3-O-deacylase